MMAVEWLANKLKIEFGFAFSDNILEEAKVLEQNKNKMKITVKYIYYRDVQGSSDRSFKTIQEVHKYAKMMNIENYEVKEVIEITR